MLYVAVVLCCWFKSSWGSQDWSFPPGFKFGAASSAYQIEGGWNADDKSESIWDVFSHTHPEYIADRGTGDVACDSYNNWERDIEMAAELGLDFYRFSISWTRLLPTSLSNNISEVGTKYYNNLIDGLLAKGIEPVVTIYHWDLPERIQKLGGWTNPLTTDWFADYARVVFTLFGDRVKTWVTINEPSLICDVAYNSGQLAPGLFEPGFGDYLCSKHVLLAHAKAYRIYDEEFRAKYRGEVSFTNHFGWMEAESEDEEELAELIRQISSGLYCHPIYSKEGGWPPSFEKLIAEKSRKEGYSRSRLPEFTKEEKELIQGTYDYLGFNHYTSRMIRKAKPGEVLGSWPFDDAPELNAKMLVKPEWPVAGSSWFAVNPEGIRNILVWIKKQYGDMKIFILENGYASTDRTLNDVTRIQYFKDYLKQVLLAIKEDGVNVIGYTAWTLMDNFEWTDGYTVTFGLYDVDFDDPARTRTPRASARYYANVIRQRFLDVTRVSDEL